MLGLGAGAAWYPGLGTGGIPYSLSSYSSHGGQGNQRAWQGIAETAWQEIYKGAWQVPVQ